ncbi:MAG TPA: hypothetical protein VFZ53_09800 [Polyangiaceae bacterium]
MRAARTALLVACAMFFARNVAANGRFPNAQQVRELDAKSLVVAGTYGLLITTNGGKDFAYVCEAEMFGAAAGALTMDPLLERTPDGSFVTGSREGARVARERGCTFETVESLPHGYEFFGLERPADAELGALVDFTRRGSGEAAPLLALVSLLDEAGFPVEHRVYEARVGTDFMAIGAPIPSSELGFALTLDVASSNPARFYVSGRLGERAVLASSDDGGQSWGTSAIAGADGALGVYLAGVSPSDERRVYARVSRTRLTDAAYYVWDDSLLVSDDGGDSFVEVLRRDAALLGFSLSRDGETVLAGFGDPRRDAALSQRSELGIYSGSGSLPASDMTFARIVSDLDVNCLYWTASGLYACATEADPLGVDPALEPDFHLGIHTGSGLPSGRADFTPLLRLRDVRGPAPWTDGRPSPCDAEWRTTDPLAPIPFGACAPLNACEGMTALSPGALVCGAGDASGDGGAGARDESLPSREAGCACRSSGSVPRSWLAWLGAMGLLCCLRHRARTAVARAQERGY